MPPRRTPRAPTGEERALWRKAVAGAAPLRDPPPVPPSPGAAPVGPTAPLSVPPASPAPPPGGSAGPPRAALRSPGTGVSEPAVTVDLAPGPLGAGRGGVPLDRRTAVRLRRGRAEPEARLDLHGMTRHAAQLALARFVLAAQAQGMRLVLVITGKGRPDPGTTLIPERQGILRHAVPHWLAAPPLAGRVLSVTEAHQRHGGAGALYLTLRRRP